jgi:hypothetical protein
VTLVAVLSYTVTLPILAGFGQQVCLEFLIELFDQARSCCTTPIRLNRINELAGLCNTLYSTTRVSWIEIGDKTTVVAIRKEVEGLGGSGCEAVQVGRFPERDSIREPKLN